MKKILILIISSLFLASCTAPLTPDQNQTQLQTKQTDDIQVPPPTGMDVVNLFWQLINDHRIPEAIDMMNPNSVSDDSTKQAYGVQFNDIKSVNVIDVKPYDPDSWTTDNQMYKVTLEIYISQDAANLSIPYYGYADNPNIRFIGITKNEAGIWQIDGIATGP